MRNNAYTLFLEQKDQITSRIAAEQSDITHRAFKEQGELKEERDNATAKLEVWKSMAIKNSIKTLSSGIEKSNADTVTMGFSSLIEALKELENESIDEILAGIGVKTKDVMTDDKDEIMSEANASEKSLSEVVSDPNLELTEDIKLKLNSFISDVKDKLNLNEPTTKVMKVLS